MNEPSGEVRWEQRGMAALAIVYVAMFYLVLRGPLGGDADIDTTCIGYSLVLAIPLAVRSRTWFTITCAIIAAIVLAGGVIGMMAGWFLFWPAILPLLLAPLARLPERWTTTVAPVMLVR